MLALFADDQVNDFAAKVAAESGQKIVTTVVVSAITAVASFLIGRWWGRYKAGREWKSKAFLHRLIVSLNVFAGGYLKIRTVFERSIDEVFLNRIAADLVDAAARQCTAADPILRIPKADRWYVLNFVLNAVAERFAAGHVKQDAGLPVTSVTYLLFLTCEVVGDERIRKVRAMMLRKEHVENFPYADSLPQLENPWHVERIKTLRKAAEVYKTEPDLFLMLEICA